MHWRHPGLIILFDYIHNMTFDLVGILSIHTHCYLIYCLPPGILLSIFNSIEFIIIFIILYLFYSRSNEPNKQQLISCSISLVGIFSLYWFFDGYYWMILISFDHSLKLIQYYRIHDIIISFIVILAAAYYYRAELYKTIINAIDVKNSILIFMTSLLIIILLFIYGNIIKYYIGSKPSPIPNNNLEMEVILLQAAAALLIASNQEIMYRMILFRNIANYSSNSFALLLSSILFTFIHHPISFGRILWTFPLSVIITLLYIKYKTIIIPIFIHFIFLYSRFIHVKY
jgi:membrane protease YdiL (CAAX protease family)